MTGAILSSGTAPSHRFALRVSINDVACEVAVNGVPVVRNYRGDRLDMEVPVSAFVVTGANSVSITTLVDRSAVGSSTTRADATLLATPAAVLDWRPLMTVHTRGTPNGADEATAQVEQTLLGPAGPQTSVFDAEIQLLETGRRIDLGIAQPTWNWQRGRALGDDVDDDEIVQALVRWYQTLHAAIGAGQVEAVAAAMAEKVSEIAVAMQMEPELVADEFGLAHATSDPALSLQQVRWNELELERAAGGRLLRLYHPEDGAVVVFTDQSGLFYTFDFWLRAGSGEWVVAR